MHGRVTKPASIHETLCAIRALCSPAEQDRGIGERQAPAIALAHRDAARPY